MIYQKRVNEKRKEQLNNMSPFRSKAQMRAAFGGYLGRKMKKKAKQWVKETPNIKALPKKVGLKRTKKRTTKRKK